MKMCLKSRSALLYVHFHAELPALTPGKLCVTVSVTHCGRDRFSAAQEISPGPETKRIDRFNYSVSVLLTFC